MNQEEVSFEAAKNKVCKNCGHYMSSHEFELSELGCIALDEHGETVTLTDDQVFEETGHHIGEKVAFMKLCRGEKGKQKLFNPDDDISKACDCENFEESFR